MATTNRRYIFLAFIFSAIGAIFNTVSLGTEQWITGKAVLVNGTGDVSEINYGLFQGNYRRRFAFDYSYQLSMTCSYKNNICALLCGKDSQDELDLLMDLYKSNINTDYSMDNCVRIGKVSYGYQSFEDKVVRANAGISVSSDSFINAMVWLWTLIFLILAALVGFAASVLAMYNTVTNPIQYFLSVKSLFIYNAVAFFLTVLYMILWGTMYNLKLFHNVAIYDTIVHSITSNKTAWLGYSYWISFISLFFYACSIAILYYREYLNAHDSKHTKVALDADGTDPNLYLY